VSRRRSRSERGAVAVLVGILSVVIFIVAALVVDLGDGRDQRRQARSAADAAALAAANELYIHTFSETPRITQAVSAAKTYALKNFNISLSSWDTCTDANQLAYVPASSTPCISFDQAAKPTTVRVKLPTTHVNTFLAPIIGVRTIDVGALAHASLQADNKVPCALCILGSGLHDLQNGDAKVANGDVQFNGSVSVGPNGLVVTNGSISVQGTASGSLDNYTPDPITGAPALTDPFRHLNLPPNYSSLTTKSNPCTDGPGIYGAYDFPNSTCTLQSGLYVIAGSSSAIWKVNGSGTVAGSGVTLYFTCGSTAAPRTCNSGEVGANLDNSGGGKLAISAPTSGDLKGLAVVYDRQNTATLKMAGNPSSNITGAFYAASGTLLMSGTPDGTITTQIVVGDLAMNGNNAGLTMTYASGGAPDQVPKLYLSR
jgi:Flp pilus assembly protein TadG